MRYREETLIGERRFVIEIEFDGSDPFQRSHVIDLLRARRALEEQGEQERAS